ncbi:cadherin-16 isoform X1 [Phascolarctos cinereus]|uniref:Cadherin-16 isoform X1 n=2 Tax=Phascolarctos cinereus TaxID=38626 RepID=A0A6P5KKF9_PHACI|nr:cadherin-16 isoform X1 [Phascolarctos cinereus]XP_020845088.1 cadherin-16 isoform X1 [Phascolarctos cinereus]XP_020845089.1 cadherin-16 isoform X1 [Phascolarctos cinereus]XP_020845090.1 cadherin-16 isoform X1 [Phascolarctos cinereus]
MFLGRFLPLKTTPSARPPVMAAIWLGIFCSFICQVVPEAVTSELHVEVPENYAGNFPLYLKKLKLPPVHSEGPTVVHVAGDEATEGLFGVESDSGFLFVTRPLDREEQAQYTLQVTITAENGSLLWGPQPLTVHVKDVNDHVPEFTKAEYTGTLSQGTHAGIPFLYLSATDGDEPGTANSDLRYHILSQTPAQPSLEIFQLEATTGGLALTEKGSSRVDPTTVSHYQLLVQVKDLGDQASGHRTMATVNIAVVANTWLPHDSIHLAENLQNLCPSSFTHVHWSGGGVEYHLESQPPGPFKVSKEGNICMTQELDREMQDKYLLSVWARNMEGLAYSDPLVLTVFVTDENDNPPNCPPADSPSEVLELSPSGMEVTRLQATDADEPTSPNAHVVYKLLSQEPAGSEGSSFTVDHDTGAVAVQDTSLMAGELYHLLVLAADLAGGEGGLSSTCEVIIKVLDVNDHAPVFTASQYGPVSLSEDTVTGTRVATVTATDADLDPEYTLIDFSIVEGDPNGTFVLDSDPQSGHADIWLQKKLDYTSAPSYELVIMAKNLAELVGSRMYPPVTATVTVLVEEPMWPPVLSQESYEVTIPDSTPPGTIVLTIEPEDPQSPPLRFSMMNDTEGWLAIEEHSGEVRTASKLGSGQPKETYTVQVVAEIMDHPSLTTTAALVLHIIRDSPPPAQKSPSLPVPVPSTLQILCTPQDRPQGVVISGLQQSGEHADDEDPYSFTLSEDPTVQREWRLQALNGTHAYLTMALSWLEPQEYFVPVFLTRSAQTQKLRIRVMVCVCNSERRCLLKVDRMKGMPTLLSAVGIMVGTLVAIGFFLILIFSHLALARKNVAQRPDSIPLKASV